MRRGILQALVAGAIASMLAGCQLYHEALKPDRIEERYVQATRKGEILNGLKTEAVIIATHLNAFDSKRYDSKVGEYFFIDIYLSPEGGESPARGLNHQLYTLTLSNGSLPVEVQELKREELLERGIYRSSRWGDYFLVRFAPQDRRYLEHLKLELKHENLGSTVMDYGFRNIKER